MQQATLPFHYAEENESTGMTALSGLPAYLDLAFVARLEASVRRHVGVREGAQGWTGRPDSGGADYAQPGRRGVGG